MPNNNIRKIMELHNANGEVVRRNVFTSNNKKAAIIDGWRKLYGKKFETLIIIQSEEPKWK